MPRLLRPPIPTSVRCRVALRQLGEMWPEDVMATNKGRWSGLLGELLGRLADLLGCTIKELHLDHNPALGAREKVFRKGVHVDYIPPANDPESLLYREASAHRIKTNVRGDGAQHPDRVLIKRQRRREQAEKGVQPVKRRVTFRPKSEASGSVTGAKPKDLRPKANLPKPQKSKWGKRSMQSRKGFRS